MLFKKQIILFVFSCLLLFSLNLSLLAAGILDPSFGNGGKIILDLGATADSIESAVLQPDGKIIIAGKTFPSNSSVDFADFLVVRLNADGSRDNTFGNNGFVTTDFTGGPDGVNSIALLPDGKIIAAGPAATSLVLNSRGIAHAMARYNPNGSLDTSFGTGGKVHADFRTGHQVISKILIQSDGKILAFGTASGDSISIPSKIGLTRYNADGSIDSSYGANGRVFIRYNEGGQFTEGTFFRGAAIQPDGKIIITGNAQSLIPGCVSTMNVNCFNLQSFMLRYTPQMLSDRKFGRRSGKEYGNHNQFWSVFLQSDGRIVIGGDNVKRYSANGRLEREFSPAAVSNVNFKIGSIAERQNRSLVGCGTLVTSTMHDAAIALFDENGRLIGTDIQNFATSENCNSVLVQTDDKILMFGAQGLRNSKIFIVRYLDITP